MRRVAPWPAGRGVAGLFAGIGGLELGFHAAGFATRLLCEIDRAARVVLETGFPGTDLIADVRELDTLPRNVEVVTAGFPCQDLSSSGLKEGIDGTQSSLVHELFRLLNTRPVEWVVIENVPFMLRLHGGAAIRTVVGRLEALGYSWAYRIIDSQSFGVPHRRKRVYIVASLHGDPRGVLLASDAPEVADAVSFQGRVLDKPIGFYWTEGAYSTGLAFNAVPPLKGGSTIGIPSPPAILLADGEVITPNIRDAEALQGFSADWTLPVESVTRSSHRWKLVGNAVTVNVAAWVAGQIAAPPRYEAANDRPLRGKKWPDAAWSIQGQRHQVECSHFPVDAVPAELDTFLRHAGKPLSRRAVAGFLSRARRGSLWYPDGFLDALDRYASRMIVLAS